MRGNSASNPGSKLKLVSVKNKKAKGKKAYLISKEMMKTYVPDVPEPADDLRLRKIRTQSNIRSASSENNYSSTSEIWIG